MLLVGIIINFIVGIPIKQRGWLMESKEPFVFFVAQMSLNESLGVKSLTPLHSGLEGKPMKRHCPLLVVKTHTSGGENLQGLWVKMSKPS